MSSEPVIEARALGKAYPIYRKPEDRLKQLLWGGGTATTRNSGRSET